MESAAPSPLLGVPEAERVCANDLCFAILDSFPEQLKIDVIKEPEISGEIADRPGINQVWAGIESKRWDLILAEESSRLYRHHTKAGELFESAVDAGVRVICPSDYIDTADDDWPDRLHMCQMQHSRSNFYTRQRIRRAHDGLWARGAAVGNTVIGYKRRCTVLATETEPAKGPFYDEIDPEKAAVILRQLLDGPIRVIPYMRIDGKRVVPRLEFALNLVAALPPAVAGPLRQSDPSDEPQPVLLKRAFLINAFHEPDLVRHARLIVERRLQGKTYKAIAEELGLTKFHMENCARITRLMEEAGLPEPYHRLTEKPDHVPQWCSKHWLKAGDHKSGGKRRRAS